MPKYRSSRVVLESVPASFLPELDAPLELGAPIDVRVLQVERSAEPDADGPWQVHDYYISQGTGELVDELHASGLMLEEAMRSLERSIESREAEGYKRLVGAKAKRRVAAIEARVGRLTPALGAPRRECVLDFDIAPEARWTW